KLTGQLEIAIMHADFPKKWKEAKKASEIKATLLNDLRSFSIGVKSQEATSFLVGKKLNELELPEQTVTGALYRHGKLLSEKNITLKEGDEIIFIARGKAFRELQKKFISETSNG